MPDVESYILESAAAAESLPDPTLNIGRTHSLVNTGAGTAVWSSIGATPFTDAAGANTATLSVLPGHSMQVQSDGVRWVVKGSSALARRVFAASGTSDGSGNVVFTFTPAFPAVPVVAASLQTTDPDVTDLRVTALSASSCTVNARQSPGVVVLGIPVLGAPTALVGATIHLVATAAGQGV